MSRPIPIEKMVEEFKRKHKTSHLFKIDNFSLLTKYDIKRIESSVFDLGGHKWKLIVYPNAKKDGKSYLSIYLENQTSIHVELQYQVYVVSQLQAKWHPKIDVKWDFGTSSTPKRKGLPKVMSLVDLVRKGYLIEDCCMVGASLPGTKPAEPATAECFSLIEKPLNHKVTWMITKFSSFDPEKAHYSNEFVVGTRKWRIQVHPRGFEEEKDKSLSVCVSGEGFINNAPKTQTFAKYKLRVFDQVKRNHVEETNSVWVDAELGALNGVANFMALSELDEPYLVNDKFYVGVEFEVISMTKYC